MALLCEQRFRKGAVHICWRIADGWQGQAWAAGPAQWLQGKVCSGSGFGAAVLQFFLLLLFSTRQALWSVSKEETALWTVCRQDSRSAARADHWWWSVWQTPIRLSLYLFFGAPLSRWPVESLPYSMILGRRWSSILKLYPSQRSCVFNNMASVLVTSACSRTSMLVMNLLQWMFRMVGSADRSAQGVVDSDDRWPMTQSCTGGWTVQRLCTCCSSLLCLLFQTVLYSLPNALFPFASLLSISLSILASDETG